MSLLDLPWHEIVAFERPLEMIVRGSLTFLGLLFIMRVVLRRQHGTMISSDLLVTVLIADAIQNGMAGEYHSVSDGLLLVTTIILWDLLIDWLCFRVKFMAKLMTSPPLLLVRDGRIIRKNLRKEFISDEELWERLRENGIDKIEHVKAAHLENDGEISVVKA